MLSPAQDTEKQAVSWPLAVISHPRGRVATGQAAHGGSGRGLREPGQSRGSSITAWRLRLLSTHGPGTTLSMPLRTLGLGVFPRKPGQARK